MHAQLEYLTIKDNDLEFSFLLFFKGIISRNTALHLKIDPYIYIFESLIFYIVLCYYRKKIREIIKR